ncbi:poly(3-hydroxyalkanoate) depolymerase [Chryseobacterium sp. RP-3-3]|uniref:Poly(3-hydroxyalkanoate) depolymerase n=1 Tax=Chryseobacterium antibioticum TaxID=2728847 RepID=A0A7Y0AKB9_9FLAO|nr:phosphopantetheine-binding protein [Chryseobacterium antibioticum]NML68962.1 poly(3-hydroxyalkanoate) depolymerase [Chryseobacterium antibioticum]
MKEELEAVIRENLIEIMPELEDESFSSEETFVDLGANSLDRGELITLTLERIGLDISRIDFVNAKTISELADLIAQKRKELN